ncbi:hypothetical protein ACFXAE_19270 [Streptomyces sp. NPDC059454]|uniref:hypothetical protein n=1 Tax=Streptomyces sp. NPDC059454 TaxID=3346836 RepID=UPI00369D77FB
MIRDLIFAEAARTQFTALPKRLKRDVGNALLRIAQEADRHGVWRAEGEDRLTVTYEVHRNALLVTDIARGRAAPAGRRQPYYGMEMRHEGQGRWTHLNPHEE